MSWKRSNPEKRLRPLFDILQENFRNELWVDVGSGDGTMGKILKSKFPYFTIINTEILNNLDFEFQGVMNYIETLSFRKKSIDGFLISQIFHYIPSTDLTEVFNKLVAALSTNGQILIIEYEMNRSYSWIPYPVTISQIKSIVKLHPSLKIINFKQIQDGNRPKYSVLIKKLE